MERKIKFQFSDGKWYDMVVYDVVDPVAEEQIETLQAENDRMKKALVKYGDHKPTCAMQSAAAIDGHDSYGCTCGLDEILKGGE